MGGENLKLRTKQFALRIIRLVNSLPKNMVGNVLGKQLLRSGTGVGANYRSACRSRSAADFISRISIAEEEADESLFWMELLVESNVISESKALNLMQEANELVSIFVSSAKTARKSKD